MDSGICRNYLMLRKLTKFFPIIETTEFHLDESYKVSLKDHGIDSFESLMDTKSGTLVSFSNETQIIRLTLSDKQNSTFFIKRSLSAAFNRSIAMCFRFAKPHTRSIKEFQLITHLKANGFPVMIPVAWGEQRLFGLPIRGVLVVKEIKGIELEDAFLNGNHHERCTLAKQLGEFLGRLNNAGFFHIIRLKDIIIAASNDEYWDAKSLVLIDREVTKPWPRKFSPEKCCYCLARCYAKFIRAEFTFTPKQFSIFLNAYIKEIKQKWEPTRQELLQKTSKHLKKILKSARYVNALKMINTIYETR